MKNKNIIQFFLATLLLISVSFGAALAGEYPEKPITLIINVKPGGSHDLNARVISSVIPGYLGQPMILKFMPGASGQTGTAAAIRAKPDGYTLLYSSNYADTIIPLIEDLPYDTIESLVTVARNNYAAALVFVLADKPWKTLEEMLEYGKENPGKLKYCHAGNWGPLFVPMASVFSEAGVDAKFIPYHGGGPALQGTLAGDCDFSSAFPSVIISLYQAGKVRILANLADKRHKDFPEVPAITEIGYKPFEMHRIFLVSRKTPEDRIKVLREAFRKINGDKSLKKLMAKLGENMEWMDGPEYERLRLQLSNHYVNLIEEITGERPSRKK
jgi:tripartite-type tricarboxylate transporter receptor subunit TctC